MEFLNNHVEITKKETLKLESFIIKSLKEFKEGGKSKEFAIDNCRNLLYQEFIRTNFIGKYSSHFENVYTTFIHSFDSYNKNDKNIDIVKLILKNEIYNQYKDFSRINKIINHKYDEDFDNVTFEKFVTHLLKYSAAKKAYNNLLNNCELYYLFYDKNDYTDFTLESFDDNVINTELYQNLFSKFYPNEIIPTTKKKISEFNNAYNDVIINDIDEEKNIKIKLIETENKTIKHSNVDINKIKNKNSTIEVEEKDKVTLLNDENCLLIFLFKEIMLEGGFKTDAEFYKVISLVQIKQTFEFKNKDSYRSSNEYKAIGGKTNNINLKNLASNTKQLLREYNSLLENLSIKIKPQKLENINKKIKDLKTDIQAQIK